MVQDPEAVAREGGDPSQLGLEGTTHTDTSLYFTSKQGCPGGEEAKDEEEHEAVDEEKCGRIEGEEEDADESKDASFGSAEGESPD